MEIPHYEYNNINNINNYNFNQYHLFKGNAFLLALANKKVINKPTSNKQFYNNKKLQELGPLKLLQAYSKRELEFNHLEYHATQIASLLGIIIN